MDSICLVVVFWGMGVQASIGFVRYFWLDPKVTKRSRLNRPVYSGQRFRCRLRNSLRSDSAGSCRSTFALRLTTVRLGLSKKAPLSLGMADTDTYMADTDTYMAGGIGHPQRAVRLYFRPKLVSVKRRDRSERPERLLSERSEFQTRQRTEGTE